jgi:hypothetical protein
MCISRYFYRGTVFWSYFSLHLYCILQADIALLLQYVGIPTVCLSANYLRACSSVDITVLLLRFSGRISPCNLFMYPLVDIALLVG